MDNKESKEGFVHSIKVPKTYRDVAKIIKKVIGDGSGLKCSVYNNNTDFNRNNQRYLALASKILKNSPKIEHILKTTQILIKESRLDPWLSRVLIYELLWRKDLNHPSKPVQTILTYKKEIQDALKTFKEDNNDIPTKKVERPRYARVNTFKKDLSDVIAQLRDEGMILLPSFQDTYSEYLDTVNTLKQNQMMLDYHIKEMLVFCPKFCFAKHEFFRDGVLIFQDKASCLAPLLLNPPEGSVVLDMCAAPGMKTNYLANLVGKNGRVYAVEKCQHRYLMMSHLIQTQGLNNVKCIFEDATKLDGNQFADVEYILVDPSCSGSGIVNRIDHTENEQGRLKSLACFQTRILRFALTRFPKVKRVVYSTCSIHPEENEEVVSNVLQSTNNFKLVNLQEKMQPNWNNFGSEVYGTIGTSCLYAVPEKDFTNGFFVAVFKRIKEENKKHKYIDRTKVKKKYNENTDDLVNLAEERELRNISTKKMKHKIPKQKIDKSNNVNQTENTNEENKQTESSEHNTINDSKNEDNINENENTTVRKKRMQRRGKVSKSNYRRRILQYRRAKMRLKKIQETQKNTEINDNEDKSNNDKDHLNDENQSFTDENLEEPENKRVRKEHCDKSNRDKNFDFAEMFL